MPRVPRIASHLRVWPVPCLLVLAASVSATVIAPSDLRSLSIESDDVVVGVCGESSSRWVGKKIFTDTEIVPSKSLKAQTTQPLVITQLGGTVDEPYRMRMVVPGAPQFREGERVLVFLHKGKRTTQVMGWEQGKFTIETGDDGTERVSATGTNEGAALDGRPLAEVLEEIEGYLEEAQSQVESDKEVAP